MTKRSILAAGSAALLVLASCGGDDESNDTAAPVETSASSSEPMSTEAPSESTITVEGAWARTSPMGVDKGAAYMVITSSIDDRLLGAAVSSEIADDAQIHEVVMADGDGMSSDTMMSDDTMTSDDTTAMSDDTMAPSMVMQEVDAIDLPAGEAVALEPGGYHVMLVGLAAPLDIGQEFVVTLTFEQAGDVEVAVVVADDAPMP